jgi:hypothetical protein
VLPEHALNSPIAGLMEPIGLHADHFHHLAAARDQFGQTMAVGVGERAWFGTNAFSEQGDDLSIECVMCGRALRCKGKIDEASRPVQSCVRPVSAVLMTAGLDEVRGSDPNQFFALDVL